MTNGIEDVDLFSSTSSVLTRPSHVRPAAEDSLTSMALINNTNDEKCMWQSWVFFGFCFWSSTAKYTQTKLSCRWNFLLFKGALHKETHQKTSERCFASQSEIKTTMQQVVQTLVSDLPPLWIWAVKLHAWRLFFWWKENWRKTQRDELMFGRVRIKLDRVET